MGDLQCLNGRFLGCFSVFAWYFFRDSGFSEFRHLGSSVFRYLGISVSRYFGITISRYSGFPISRYHDITIFQYSGISSSRNTVNPEPDDTIPPLLPNTPRPVALRIGGTAPEFIAGVYSFLGDAFDHRFAANGTSWGFGLFALFRAMGQSFGG